MTTVCPFGDWLLTKQLTQPLKISTNVYRCSSTPWLFCNYCCQVPACSFIFENWIFHVPGLSPLSPDESLLTSWVPIGSLFTFQHRLPGTPTWPTLEHLKCPVDIVNVEQWWTINVIARGGNLYTSFHTTAAAVIGLGPKCWNGMWTFIAIEHRS